MTDETSGKPFCVISPTVDASGIRRSWKSTVDDAVKHAQKILDEAQHRQRGRVRRLFVVQVVKVVEVPTIATTVRDPTPDDITVHEGSRVLIALGPDFEE